MKANSNLRGKIPLAGQFYFYQLGIDSKLLLLPQNLYLYVSVLQVCHATHDVTYSKHGSFFCDCGAKEDGSCQALVKRSSSAMMSERPSMTSTASNLGYEPMLPSSLRIRPTSPTGLTNLNKTLTGGDLDSKPVNIF